MKIDGVAFKNDSLEVSCRKWYKYSISASYFMADRLRETPKEIEWTCPRVINLNFAIQVKRSFIQNL